MKKIILLFVIAFNSVVLSAQNVGIGTTTPDTSSVLDITHPFKGLLIPRMTTTAISSVANPAKGLLVYDSTVNLLKINAGTKTTPAWQAVGGGWNLSGNSGTNPATHFIGTLDNSPLLF